jgi:hypothetical protein
MYVCMYVCSYVVKRSRSYIFSKYKFFLEEIATDLAQNLQRNNCHLGMVILFKM